MREHKRENILCWVSPDRIINHYRMPLSNHVVHLFTLKNNHIPRREHVLTDINTFMHSGDFSACVRATSSRLRKSAE